MIVQFFMNLKKLFNPWFKAFKRYKVLITFVVVKMTNGLRKSNNYDNRIVGGITANNITLILFELLPLNVTTYAL